MPDISDWIGAGEILTGEWFLVKEPARRPYDIIKGVEDLFPVPTPAATVDVGTLDSFTGEFTGHVSTPEVQPPLPGGFGSHKPQIVHVPPRVEVDAVNVSLRFTIANRQSDFSVTVDNITVQSSSASDSVVIDVGRAYAVDWVLDAGPDRIEDRIILQRPLSIGAGVFTLPALPVTVIYEPPADRRALNSAAYSTSSTIGTKVTTSFTTEDSTTRPARSAYSHINGLKSQLQGFSTAIEMGVKLASGTPEPSKDILLGAIKVVMDGLGSASATSTTGLKTSSDASLVISDTVEDGMTTGANDGGPGIGDLIVFLRDVELCWVASGGQVSLAVINYDRIAIRAVASLEQELSAGTSDLAPEVLQALLALDPFVSGGPTANLDPARFAFVEAYEVNGTTFTKSFTHQVTQADRSATTEFKVDVEDMRAGFLSFTGLGVPETVSIKSSSSHSTSVEESQTNIARIALSLHAEIDEIYAVQVFYDRVFGTFAVRRLVLDAAPIVAGSLTDAEGVPLAGQLISIVAGETTTTTLTDDRGRYEFRTLPRKNANTPSIRIGARSFDIPEAADAATSMTVRLEDIVLSRSTTASAQ